MSSTDDNQTQAAVNDSEKQAPVVPTPEFPDGGLRAWLVVVGTACVFLTTFGQVNSFGAFEDYYVRVYLSNRSAADISWIGSVQLCFQSLLGIISGAAFDRGYYYHIVGSGSVLYVICLFMLSLAKPHQYYQIFLAQGVGMGIALGLIFIPTMSIVSHYFRRRRSFALGLVFAGSSIGGVTLPIMVNNLLNGPVGFANGVRAMAGLTVGMFCIGQMMIRPRPRSDIHSGQKVKMDVRAYLRDTPYVLVVIAAAITTLGLWIPMTYLQLDATMHGIDGTFAFYVPTILNAASFFGRLLPNFLADKIGVLRMLAITGAISSCICLGMLGIKEGSKGPIAAIAATYGFFSGANISLWGVAVAECSPSIQELGSRTGFLYIWVGLAALLGNPIGGWLLTSNYDWWKLVLWSFITVQTSVWLLVVADTIRRRNLRLASNASASKEETTDNSECNEKQK